MLLLPFAAGYAQEEDREPVYFYVTSKGEDTDEGFSRRTRVNNNNPLYNTPPIYFTYEADNKGVEVHFTHYNYNTYELSKKRQVYWDDTMEIRTEPASFLDNNYIIDLDELFDTMSKEEIWDYTDELYNKKIYLIDKNPEYGQINQQTVKLIQVKLSSNNRPGGLIVKEGGMK